MHIILINHYAGSPEMGMEFRPYYFAREWVKKGHRVDVFAADYSHLRRVNPKIKHDFQVQKIDGIYYHWIKTNKYDGNGVKRALTMAEFISKLWLRAGRIVKKYNPDVIITSSTYPLDTFVGQRIRRISKKKVKLIHEVHDMWPISPIEIGGMSPKNPFIRVMQYGEDSFCKKSDLVVSLLPCAKEYLHTHGMTYEKFRHISNGVVLSEWEKPQPLPEEHERVLNALKEKGKFVLCFFGSHTKSYSLDYLVDAAKEIIDDRLHVVFVGDGIYKNELLKKSKGYEDRFTFLSSIPKTSIPSLFEKIDATYVGAVNNNMFRFGICMNKLFDSMMGGKPILYAVNAPNNYIEEYGCGISVKAENKDALIDGLSRLLNMSAEEKAQMGNNGKNAALSHFNYTVLSEKFLEILQEK